MQWSIVILQKSKKENETGEKSAKNLNAETILKYESEYVLHPRVAQKGLTPVIVDRAKGNYFYDPSGKQYLDFSSLFVFNNLGHTDPRIVEAISKQAARLETAASPFATEAKAKLSKLVAEVTPGDIKKTFFSTSGAEANEGAIKIARAATGKEKIIARYRSYHANLWCHDAHQ